MAYIDKSRAIGMLERFRGEHSNLPNACLKMIDVALNIIKQIPTADVVEVVRCKDCTEWNEKEGECSHWYGFRENDFCSYGTPKERDADKPKITCLNCKHLMFSDMYGECNKQLRIVHPSDTCEFAEPKERGGEK